MAALRPACPDVEHLLATQRRRVRAALFLRALAVAFPLLLLAGSVVVAAVRLGPFDLGPLGHPSRAAWLVVAVTATVLAGAGLTAWLRTPAAGALALELDRRLGTRELIVAAHEAGPQATHPLALEARRRATLRLRQADARGLLPLTRGSRWVPTLLTLALLLLTPWLPEPPGAKAGPPDPALAAAGETLERRLDAIAARGLPFGEPAEKPFRELQQFAAQLQDGGLADPRDALLALERIEQAVEAASWTEGGAATGVGRGDLASVLEEMSADPFAGDVARSISARDVDALRQSLERLAGALTPDQLSAEGHAERMERLAERLDRLAEELRRLGYDEEADLLDELAEAIRNNDIERARELIQQMTTQAACERMVAGGELGDLLRELGESVTLARYLLNLENPPKLEQHAGKAGGRAGPHPGTTSTNEQAEGYETGAPIVRDRRSQELSDARGEYEALYESHIVQAESWVDAQARGKLGERGELFSETGRSLGAPGESRLPPGSFDSAAPGGEQRAAELERVPLGYRDLVRRYFSRGATAGEPAGNETRGDGRDDGGKEER